MQNPTSQNGERVHGTSIGLVGGKWPEAGKGPGGEARWTARGPLEADVASSYLLMSD